jgi:mRNA interferase RelE/StbE
MSYKLKFVPSAWKEWNKLDRSIQSQLKKKLAERLENPRVLSSKLRGFDSAYKIKLRASGYRLVYEVMDEEVTVFVIAIGKRDQSDVYKKAKGRRS